MERHGSRPEDFALIASWARRNAQENPNAIFFGKPATVEEVLASPVLASPLHLYEAVLPVAGAEAVIVSSASRARLRGQAIVHLLGAGEKITHRAASQAPDPTEGPMRQAMSRAFEQAGSTARDMDLLLLYDSYSVTVALALEGAGLCKTGQFGPWLKERDLSSKGDTPLNTHGGQIGFGQPDIAGGMTHVVEAVRQLRGAALGRQIPNPNLALVTGSGATVGEATALVLGCE
ncbi:hypothetical protein N182_29925 [Sinorhizobium sp. GL2]|nr:hypothetical protein N182_29925 [Sinorhizobium sp. GL2]